MNQQLNNLLEVGEIVLEDGISGHHILFLSIIDKNNPKHYIKIGNIRVNMLNIAFNPVNHNLKLTHSLTILQKNLANTEILCYN